MSPGTARRRYVGSLGDQKTSFPFVAEGAGVYAITVTDPGDKGASYQLLLEDIVSLDERFRPEDWADPNPSPRIQSLRNQIASGQASTEAFWRQVAEQGTPLVDCCEIATTPKLQNDRVSLRVVGKQEVIRFPPVCPSFVLTLLDDHTINMSAT